MKARAFLLIFAITLVAFSNCKKSNIAQQGMLIADYPLTKDGVDVTGNNAAMTLQNTPFQNGGIYCNGIYEFSTIPDFCIAQSPPINALNLQAFSVSVDFFVSEKMGQPVWVIGRGCRWLGFYLYGDETVALLYNNSNYLYTQKACSLNEWHNAKITYQDSTANIFLDNNLAGTLKFGNGVAPLDFSTCGTSDAEIGITNYSDGEVFKGIIKNLKVYNLQ